MTAFSDVMPATAVRPDAADLPLNADTDTAHALDGHLVLVRVLQKLLGASLVMAAMGLWLQPGAQLETDVLLMKFVLSLVMGFAGLAVFQASWPAAGAEGDTEIEIDTVRQEVRTVRGRGRARTVLARTRMCDLGAAEPTSDGLRLWDAEGTLMAEVQLTDATARASLTTALRCAGKL
ncbi:hypothetical protein [uncultured Tateyamaria sp.]|uniref:hypothetical protein n=1 Tax=uncultured Tateyamaria sp. TaxID=455651 RepID=UPI002616EFC5|nr:hypothetical protein [uncultured Tateyamaria sp.]